MGRFAHLDLRPETDARGTSTVDWPDLDETRCMTTGDDHFNAGNYDAALTFYSRSLRFNRDLASAWVGQIRCLLALGEYREAVTWTDRALDRFANTPDLLACKGLALSRLGDPEGMSFLDSAIALKSAGPWVWLARGESLLLHKTAEANANRCMLKALEMSGGDWRTELRIGIAYNTVGLNSKARGPLFSAVRSAPDNPLALYHLGVAYQALGEADAAAGCFSRAHGLGYKDASRALETLRARGPVSRLLDSLWRKR